MRTPRPGGSQPHPHRVLPLVLAVWWLASTGLAQERPVPPSTPLTAAKAAKALKGERVSPPTEASAPNAEGKDAAQPTIVDHATGLFGEVYVVDEGRFRALRFGSPTADDQTMIDREDPKQTPVEYIRAAGAALGFARFERGAPKTALIVGLGGGSFVHHVRQLEPSIAIDAVEIDPVVVRFAKTYFGLATTDGLDIQVEDGAQFLQQSKERWNVILLDAYGSDDMPPTLTSSAFFRSVRNRVAKEGAVVLNLAVGPATEKQILSRFIPLFSQCLTVRTPEDRNLVVIGTDRAIDPRHARASDVARRRRAKLPMLPLHFKSCRDPEPE